MPFGMGFGELVLILLVLLVIFGATKLPQLGDGLGKAIKNFKRASASPGSIDVAPTRTSVETDASRAGKATNAPPKDGR
jgi:sec-independent protein translocase protein TatA